MRALVLAGAVAAAMVGQSATAAQSTARVTVSAPQIEFSAPIFRWENLSSPGVQITAVEFYGGAPIDWILRPDGGVYAIQDPAGGTRSLLRGQEATVDTNDGCTNGVSYGLTSFSPGDSFQFGVDPETDGCGSAVVDYRPFLRSSQVTAAVTFSNGTILSGNSWSEDLIDPQGPNNGQNQRLVLTHSQTAVPEPASWAMLIAGFGLTGALLRRRRLANRIVSA